MVDSVHRNRRFISEPSTHSGEVRQNFAVSLLAFVRCTSVEKASDWNAGNICVMILQSCISGCISDRGSNGLRGSRECRITIDPPELLDNRPRLLKPGAVLHLLLKIVAFCCLLIPLTARSRSRLFPRQVECGCLSRSAVGKTSTFSGLEIDPGELADPTSSTLKQS